MRKMATRPRIRVLSQARAQILSATHLDLEYPSGDADLGSCDIDSDIGNGNALGPSTVAVEEQRYSLGGLLPVVDRASLMRFSMPTGSLVTSKNLELDRILTCNVVFHKAAKSHAEVDCPRSLHVPQLISLAQRVFVQVAHMDDQCRSLSD